MHGSNYNIQHSREPIIRGRHGESEIGVHSSGRASWKRRTEGHPKRYHFRKPVEGRFTAQERNGTTILFGGLTWKHEALIQAVMKGIGYQAKPLPVPDKQSYQIGREFCNPGQCNPTYFTVGNLIRYLQELESTGMSRDEIIRSHVFFTAGACGPCRFGMYESEYRAALRLAGFEGFRVLILQQTGGLQQSGDEAGLSMDIDFTLGLIHAFNIGDVLNDLASQLRPFEMKKGSTEIALRSSIEHMASVLEKSYRSYRSIRAFRTLRRFLRHAFSISIPRELGRCREYFGQVCLDPSQVKPVVKITGEFWAQTTEGEGNFRMFEFLEEEGAQVVLEPIATWLLYMLHQAKQETRDRVFVKAGARRSMSARVGTAVSEGIGFLFAMLKLTLAEVLFTRDYNRFRKMLNCIPWPLPSQRLYKKLAEPFFNTRIEGGEGHLEIAKTLYYTRNHLCHMMLSLKPFGCLPSTQSDGVMSTVTAHYPDILFLPIETAGDGGIHAYSRVQMTLAEAKKRARREYEEALSETRLSTEAVREFMDRHPEVRNPFHRFWKVGPAIPKAACLVRCMAAGEKGPRNGM